MSTTPTVDPVRAYHVKHGRHPWYWQSAAGRPYLVGWTGGGPGSFLLPGPGPDPVAVVGRLDSGDIEPCEAWGGTWTLIDPPGSAQPDPRDGALREAGEAITSLWSEMRREMRALGATEPPAGVAAEVERVLRVIAAARRRRAP